MALFSFGPSDSQRRAREAKRRARLAAQRRRRELLRASLALIILLAILTSLYSMAVLIRKHPHLDTVQQGMRNFDDGSARTVDEQQRAASADDIAKPAGHNLRHIKYNAAGIDFMNPVNAAEIGGAGRTGSDIGAAGENIGHAEVLSGNTSVADIVSSDDDLPTGRAKGYPNDKSNTDSDSASTRSNGKFGDERQIPGGERHLTLPRYKTEDRTDEWAGNSATERRGPQLKSHAESVARAYSVDKGSGGGKQLVGQPQTHYVDQATGAEGFVNAGHEAHQADALDEEEGGEAPIIALAKRGEQGGSRDANVGMVVVRDAGRPAQQD